MENLKELMEILSDPIFSSPIRVGILLALTGIKTITFSELQKNLGINKSTLSVNLKILENNGLIEIKTKFFKDRPREVIVITEKGKKLVEKYLETILKYKEITEENNNENIK